jgi:hypothetical protein
MAAHALAEHEPLKVLLTVAHGKVVDELGQDVTQQPTPTSRWIRRSAGVAAAPTPTSAPFATTSGVTPPRTATTIQARWLAATVAASAGSTRHAMCLSSPTRRSRAQRSGSAPIVSLGERRPLLPFRPPPMTPPPLPMDATTADNIMSDVVRAPAAAVQPTLPVDALPATAHDAPRRCALQPWRVLS